MRSVKPCGTEAAYYRHSRNGETPCDDCRSAAASARMRRGVTTKRFTPAAHGTNARYIGGCRCWGCKDGHAAYMRRYRGSAVRDRSRNRPNQVADVVIDVLETHMLSMSFRNLLTWVLELHPEWKAETVRRTVQRMAMDGRVERVEFGDQTRYRTP